MRKSLPLLTLSACLCLVALVHVTSPCAAAPPKRITGAGSPGAKNTPAVQPPKATTPAASALGPIQDKWAIVIGINTFADKRIPQLRYSAKDAEDFARFLVDKENFARDHVLLLTNDGATEDSILDAIGDNWLPRRAFPGDLVLVYVSSHGSPKEVDVAGENFLIAHDTKVDRLFSSGIRLEDLAPTIRKRTGCQRIVLILDACNSGAADVTSKGLIRNLNFDINSFAGEGLIVISSSQADQRSWESARYANGVFTRRLMEALEANGPNTTLTQAFASLEDSVQQEVRFDRKAFQQPLMKSKWVGTELSLAVPPSRPRKLSKELAEAEHSAPSEVSETQAIATGDTTPIASLQGLNFSPNASPPPSTSAQGSSAPTAGRPWMGVQLVVLTPEACQSLSLPAGTSGALIREISPGSGASQSGLQVNDVIQSVNGTPVSTTEQVQRLAQAHKIGDALSIGVLRNGTAQAFGVILGAMPDMPPVAQNPPQSPLDTTGSTTTPPLEAATIPVTSNVPSTTPFQATVEKNVQVLPEKIAILPFGAPDNFELTKTADYPRNFTEEDRKTMATFPLRMWQQVITDLEGQIHSGDVVIPATTIRDISLKAKDMKFDTNDLVRGSRQLGQVMGARYVVIVRITKFSFAARVMWSNEYNVKLVATILDAQKGQVIATVPMNVLKTPWLGDSALWFTSYLERMILPEFCKRVAQGIARKLPVK